MSLFEIEGFFAIFLKIHENAKDVVSVLNKKRPQIRSVLL